MPMYEDSDLDASFEDRTALPEDYGDDDCDPYRGRDFDFEEEDEDEDFEEDGERDGPFEEQYENEQFESGGAFGYYVDDEGY